MLCGHARADHQTPEVGIENAPRVFERYLLDPAIDRDAGVVDPGVESAEALECGLGDLPDLLLIAHVTLNSDSLTAPFLNFLFQIVQRLIAARSQHNPCAL